MDPEEDYRFLMARSLMSLANLLAAGIVLSLLIANPQSPYRLAAIGIVSVVGLYAIALWLMKQFHGEK